MSGSVLKDSKIITKDGSLRRTQALQIGSSSGEGQAVAQGQSTVWKDPRWALLDGGIHEAKLFIGN